MSPNGCTDVAETSITNSSQQVPEALAVQVPQQPSPAQHASSPEIEWS